MADRKIRFLMIGYGWRADFFYRIAKELPERFEICAAVLRTAKRAAEVGEQRGVFATDSLALGLAQKPDFAVLCVPRSVVGDYLKRLVEADVAVLCETPPGQSVEELNELWEIAGKGNGRIQVAEQYFMQPLYAALLQMVNSGIIGEVSTISLSALHGYHAVSIFRKILGTGFSPCKITGKRFSYPVTATDSRQGIDTSGKIRQMNRDVVTFEFEQGKTAFFDFSGEQYHSLIRTRRLNIQGVRGEINDMTVRWLDERNEAYCAELYRIDDGRYNNNGWSHRGIQFNGGFVYRNPFYGARLNDDEIAVASCLKGMSEYVSAGKAFYPLQEALWDTYLALLMEEAVSTGETVAAKKQGFAGGV